MVKEHLKKEESTFFSRIISSPYIFYSNALQGLQSVSVR
jgi:hypothetical protein